MGNATSPQVIPADQDGNKITATVLWKHGPQLGHQKAGGREMTKANDYLDDTEKTNSS